jgi:hypothetical protein
MWMRTIVVSHLQYIYHNLYVFFNISVCLAFFYPLANEVAKGYSNATVRPSVTSL